MPGRDKHGRRTPPAYRYFSPVFGFDPKTGRVTSLISLGLTNTPATRDMQALAASHRPSSLPSPRRSTTFRTPGAPARGKYMEHKMGKNQNQFASAASFEALETLKSAHADAIASLKESQASLSEANDQLKGEIASLKADSAMHQATAAAHATTLKAKDEEIASLKAVAKDVAGIVGKDSLSDAKGAFAALKQEAAAAVAKAAELTAKFEKLESDAKVAKLSQLVDQGITEGRFVPAEREHLIKQDASFVEEMLKIRPVIAKMSETKQPDPAKPPPALEGVDPELQAAMKAMGHDPAAIAASLRGAGALQQVVA
jgi:phage I-like protein